MNHIGDIYFTSFFVNLLCKLNNTTQFYYYSINGSYFFENISNLKRITELESDYTVPLMNGSPPENYLKNDILQFLINNHMQKEAFRVICVNGVDFLFVNTWCASNLLNHVDFDIQSAKESYNRLFSTINNTFQLNLKWNQHLIDIANITNISNSSVEHLDTIFIFNYVPRSLQFDMSLLNNYIVEQSKKYKIILSCYDSALDNSNITFIDRDYGIKQEPSCKNLIDLWEIAIQCKTIVILPTGSSWTFFHKLNIIKEHQIFMFKSPHYCNILNNTINALMKENKNLISNI
jgi:hypothetical protein